uniref:SRCR domain-containing protein n=1 Tax=Dicentrarchus labrax TaxID=13489 RepID=A0A8P4GF13_DICLA
MDHLLVLLLLLWSSALQTEGTPNSTESEEVRLVGGDSHCAGTLEVKHNGDWKPVWGFGWNMKEGNVVCINLDCGSAVSVVERKESSDRPVWLIHSECVKSGSSLRDCVRSSSSSYILNLTCSDSVRLVDGTSLCSGRLEVKSDQSNQWWSSVCEDDFDQQDAEVVCRELDCGAPSVLQGRSMEKWRLQCGPKSSSVEAMSLLSWTVEAQAQLETPAHLEKLFYSPAQVEEELQL